MKDFIRKYFDSRIDYPDIEVEILPVGELWCYVGSTMLKAFINYTDKISTRLVTRYNEAGYAGNLADAEKYNNSKLFLWDFEDDILILAKDRKSLKLMPKESANFRYWFFWFDQDVSDCQIGRFETQDSEETVKELFIEYANECSRDLSVNYGVEKSGVDSIEIKLPKRSWI